MASLHAPGAAVAPRLAELEEILEDELPAYLEDLATLVNVDCGSYTKAGVDQVGRWTARFLERLGASVEVRPDELLGDTVVGTFDGKPGGPRILLIGHLDTVFPEGTARARPFRIEAGIANGPGVTDMKSGLLAGLYALLALRALGTDDDGAVDLPFERLVFVANPDEEIGSPSSTPHIRELALESDVCFVLECARANGDIVSARKGTVDLRLTIRGRAAHAGVEPEKGRNAMLEAAHQTIAIQALNGRWPGVTANVGVIHGGTRPNVVAEEAGLEVDLRATSRDSLEAAEAATADDRRVDHGGGHDGHGRGSQPALADGAARAVGPARRARGRPGRAVGLRAGRLRHRRRVRREHDLGSGRPDPRRPGTDRRQRSLAGRIPRGRLDRAAHDAAGRAAAGGRPRSARGLVAAPPGMTRRLISSAAGRGRRAPATAGPWSVGDACSVVGHDRCRPRRAVAPSGRCRRTGRGRARHHRGGAGRGRIRADRRGPDPDVRRRSRGRRPRARRPRGAVRDIRPASTIVVVAGLIEPSLLVEIEADARH